LPERKTYPQGNSNPCYLHDPYIFVGAKEGQHLKNIQQAWTRIKDRAIENGASSLQREVQLPDGSTKFEHVVIHGLRHTAVVWLVNHADTDTALVGKILNHKSGLATRRYAKFKIQTKERALQNLGTMIAIAASAQAGTVVDFSGNDVQGVGRSSNLSFEKASN
jgi:integrase